MARINGYYRRVNGRRFYVKSHSRRTNYRIQRKRQLPRRNTNVSVDAAIRAKKPGKRKGPTGVYYERRFNRSDKNEFI